MCFRSGSDEEQKKGVERNREIDNLIRRDQKEMMNEVKLLLLGVLTFFTHSSPSYRKCGLWCSDS